MRQNQNYEFDFIEKKVIVTKTFLREAGRIGSQAYIELTQVRRDFPDFMIEQRQIAKKSGKKTYGKLTYATMGDFIETYEEQNAPVVLAEFERIKELSKAYNGKYAFVKKWFLDRYKEEFNQTEADETR